MVTMASSDLVPMDLDQFMKKRSEHREPSKLVETMVDGISHLEIMVFAAQLTWCHVHHGVS